MYSDRMSDMECDNRDQVRPGTNHIDSEICVANTYVHITRNANLYTGTALPASLEPYHNAVRCVTHYHRGNVFTV